MPRLPPISLYMRDGKWVVDETKFIFEEPDHPPHVEVGWSPLALEYQNLSSRELRKIARIAKYVDPTSGERFRYELPKRIHGIVCFECKKKLSPSKTRDLLRLKSEFRVAKYILKSHGAEDLIPGLISEYKKEIKEIAALPRSVFPHRDFCSEECYQKYRRRKEKERQKEKRNKVHSKTYQDLPEDRRPDGFCKICGKDISDKNAGALTCCPAHRQKYKRRKEG